MKESATDRPGQDPGTTYEQPVLRGSTLYLILVVLGSPRLLWALLGFLGTVFRRFFFDQFVYRFRLRPRSARKPRLRNVEHPLDATIPARFEAIGVYLTFIQLWISSISYLRRCLGPSFNADFIDFLTGLRRCYLDASSVYGRCLSTTKRPALAPGLRFAFVYAVDPHLFCVPSLHVLVVCYTYKKIENLLQIRDDLELFKPELAAVKARAMAITESILYVRQHSVNCIPTALSMLSVILPSYDGAEAKAFLAELFKNDADISETHRSDALAYMLGLYERVAGNGLEPGERYGAIVDFLESYEEMPIETSGAGSPEGSGAPDLPA
jgi:hypothetical protein